MFVSLYLKVIDGPLWPDFISNSVKSCSKYWYANLLYINNLYPPNLEDEVSLKCWDEYVIPCVKSSLCASYLVQVKT